MIFSANYMFFLPKKLPSEIISLFFCKQDILLLCFPCFGSKSLWYFWCIGLSVLIRVPRVHSKAMTKHMRHALGPPFWRPPGARKAAGIFSHESSQTKTEPGLNGWTTCCGTNEKSHIITLPQKLCKTPQFKGLDFLWEIFFHLY